MPPRTPTHEELDYVGLAVSAALFHINDGPHYTLPFILLYVATDGKTHNVHNLEGGPPAVYEALRSTLEMMVQDPQYAASAEVPQYTNKVGEAGEAYLKELCRSPDGSYFINPPWLPATFRWEELFKRMLEAARQ